MTVLPSFLVVGAAKSGTTSLANYLRQHPEIFIPSSKEPSYFALKGEELPPSGPAPASVLRGAIYNFCHTDWESYTALFRDVGSARAVGEASVRYLYFPKAPARIREVLPDVRIVILLRHPVSRLYSHYNMNRQVLLEPLELAEALAAEGDRIAAGWGWDWHYRAVSRYSVQLERYFELFPRAQIAVFAHEEFSRDPLGVYRAVCRHIGVDDRFVPDMSARGMVSSRPRNAALARFLWWPNKTRFRLLRYGRPLGAPLVDALKILNAAPVPKLDPEMRARLNDEFSDEIAAVETLLGRELPWRVPR